MEPLRDSFTDNRILPSASLLTMRKEDWHRLSEEQYRTLFKGSAVKRAKYQGLMRNIRSAKK